MTGLVELPNQAMFSSRASIYRFAIRILSCLFICLVFVQLSAYGVDLDNDFDSIIVKPKKEAFNTKFNRKVKRMMYRTGNHNYRKIKKNLYVVELNPNDDSITKNLKLAELNESGLF